MITRPRTARPRWTCIALAVVDGDLPDVVLRHLETDERLRRRPQRCQQTHDQHPHVALERGRIVGQLLAEHRDVLEGAADDALLEVLVVLQDESEDRWSPRAAGGRSTGRRRTTATRRSAPTGGDASRRACRRPRRRRRDRRRSAITRSLVVHAISVASASRQVPVDRRLAVVDERLVGAAERPAAEEPVVGRQRRRVRRLDDRVPGAVDQRPLAARRRCPTG